MDTVNRSSPAVRRSRDQRGLALVGRGAQPPLEPGVVGVDEDLLAGLGVLDVDHPGGRQLELAAVDHLDGDHVVAAGELAQRPPPSRARLRKSETITTSERRRAMPSAARSGTPPRSVAGAASLGLGPARLQQPGQDPQHLVAAVAGRDRRSTAGVEQHRADPVAAAGSSCATVAATSVSTTCLRRSTGPNPIDAERSSSSQAVTSRSSSVLADVRDVGAGGDVPVDVAQVVAGLVLAQVGDVDPGAAEHRPVVALQPPVEAADHPPLQPAQHPLRGQRRLCGPLPIIRGARPARSRSGTSGSGTRVEQRPEQVVGRDVVGERLVGQHQPVPQHVPGQVPRVRGQRVVAAAQEGQRLGPEHHVDRGPRAGPERHVPGQLGSPARGEVAGGGGQPHRVLDDLRVDVDGVRGALVARAAASVSITVAGASRCADGHPLDDDELLGRASGSRPGP